MVVANSAPFDVRVWIYPGASPTATDPGTWGLETDVSAFVRYPGSDGGQAIEYTAGRNDEASQVDPSTMNLTLDNRDGRFSTKNPTGPYYGSLRRNTPIRMGVVSGSDTFARTVSNAWGTADSGHTWNLSGTPTEWAVDGSKATININATNAARVAVLGGATTSEADVVMTVTPIVTATGAAYGAGPILRRTDSSNMVYTSLEFNTGGTVNVKIRKVVGGVSTDLASLAPIPSATYTAGVPWRIRAQSDGNVIRVMAWPLAGSPPTAWQASATVADLTGAAVGVYLARFSGNTNATAQIGIDDVKVTALEFTGAVVQWPVRWDKSGNNCWAPIQAAGILRRLQQGKGGLKSPLSRQLPAYGPYGYWTLEDDAGATVFGSSVQGVAPATYDGVDPASDSSLAGGANAPSLSAVTGSISGQIKKRINAGGVTGFAAMVFTKFDSGLPVSKTAVATWYTFGRATKWVFSIASTAVYMDAYDGDGGLLSSANSTFGGVNTANWVAWQLETDLSGGSTPWAFIWHEVGKTNYLSITGTVAGGLTPTSVGRWVLGGSNLPVGTSFAHHWVGPNTLPFVTNSFSLVSGGYAGESASDRITRVASEEGVSVVVEAGTSDAVGVQPLTSAMAAFRSAESADMGILYERGSGLGYRPRSVRYNQPVTMALAVAAGQIDDPPEPIDDDQRLRNQVTVTREGGSYAVASDPTSIAAEGLYEDSLTINVATDDVLPYHAGWRVYMGTRPDLRWPGMSIDFARNPDVLQQWRSRAYGLRMTVATGKSQVGGVEPDVIVEGFTSTLWPHGWKLRMNCSAATTWNVAVLDSVAVPPRLDTAGSQLQAGVNATAVSWTVDTTVGPAWNPATTFPFLLQCEGEVVSVSAISGAGPTGQVFTVARSINGVVKAHGALAPVSLAAPARLAL